LPMRGHFRYLRFKTFPMTLRTPQCEVFWALLSSSQHSGVPEDSKPPTVPSVGLHPHTCPKWGCDIFSSQPYYLKKYYQLPHLKAVRKIIKTSFCSTMKLVHPYLFVHQNYHCSEIYYIHSTQRNMVRLNNKLICLKI